MGRELSRRRFPGAMAASAVLADCATRGAPGRPTTSQGPNGRSLTWANWTLNLDYDRTSRSFPSLEAFEKQTGYTIEYREDIDTTSDLKPRCSATPPRRTRWSTPRPSAEWCRHEH